MTLRQLERVSIENFLRENADCFVGRVLDVGCGLQPYKDIVEERGATYVPFDRASFPASTVKVDVGERPGWDEQFDAIICTQVIQYLDPSAPDYDDNNPMHFLHRLGEYLIPNGRSTLLMTGPTNWPLVEEDDLWRLTPSGIRRMLARTGRFTLINVVPREHVDFEGERWALGWQAIAR